MSLKVAVGMSPKSAIIVVIIIIIKFLCNIEGSISPGIRRMAKGEVSMPVTKEFSPAKSQQLDCCILGNPQPNRDKSHSFKYKPRGVFLITFHAFKHPSSTNSKAIASYKEHWKNSTTKKLISTNCIIKWIKDREFFVGCSIMSYTNDDDLIKMNA